MSARFDRRTYVEPRPVPWLIRLLGPVNRHLLLGPVLRLRRFDLPADELARLAAVVNPRTVAFLGPNHPEFLTDWLVDKELSRRVSPLMAHWASYEIVNGSPLTQRFWLANNLVANAPGGDGKAYSIRWAQAGHGVLLHPEGTATWQGERVGPLLPGIVDMAWEAAKALAARGDARPVLVVPVVWRLRFAGDAAPGLAREMGVIERALSLPRGPAGVPERFAALLGRLLVRQCERLGLPAPGFDPAAPGTGYFREQAATLASLREELARVHAPLDADPVRAQHRLRRSIHALAKVDPEGARRDRARLAELQRLSGFDPELYDRPDLAPERVAEVLKRLRAALVTRGFANAVHNLVPVAVAPRDAHVRVPEPLAVHEAVAGGGEEDETKSRLLQALRTRLQAGLDALRERFAAEDAARSLRNPLASGSRPAAVR